MIPEPAAWLILLLPLASFALISLVIRPFFNRYAHLAGHLTALTIAGSLALSLWALQSVVREGEALGFDSHTWFALGDLNIPFGIVLDPLTAIMLVVVTGVSLMVQVYSQGYMRGDPGYARYFAYMSLFTASMIGLVLASSIIQLYVFWELVGLCSYLLIGFWYHRPAAAAAAKKAFIVTRLGDFGFLLAILYLFFHRGDFLAQGLSPFEIEHIRLLASETASAGAGLVALASGVVTWVALGIFAGAVGKSAQFPLHTWLPDAMEGPTPVSALIHAATMVAAGVFLVARFFPVFEASSTAMNLMAVIGGFTAIFAASMGLVMFDIKRVLAYSTISQLGFMMLALGVGAYGAAIFHLFNHAFFKALLFLGAGSVSHATGTFDMRYMGGLRRSMPWTYATFLAASLSIAGVPLLSGFWSKDEILAAAFDHGAVGQLVFWLALVAALMTAVYIFRALFLTFHGQFRGGIDAEEGTGDRHRVHLGESPRAMVVPMAMLAIPALASGFFINPPFSLGVIPQHWLSNFLGAHAPDVNPVALSLSIFVALGGIAVAYLTYQTRQLSAERVARALRPLYGAACRKYYFDEVYEDFLTNRVLYRCGATILNWFDSRIVDGVVDAISWFGRNIGHAMARLQTGQVQGYGAGIALGVLLIVAGYLIWGS